MEAIICWEFYHELAGYYFFLSLVVVNGWYFFLKIEITLREDIISPLAKIYKFSELWFERTATARK
jgi:hypothetical protein